MTPAEWVDVLGLVRDLWPSSKPWPKTAQDRCFYQLRRFPAELVGDAVRDLVGERPVSPAALESRVALLAARAAYSSRFDSPGLPEPDPAAAEYAAGIRGGKSWQEWIEEQHDG